MLRGQEGTIREELRQNSQQPQREEPRGKTVPWKKGSQNWRSVSWKGARDKHHLLPRLLAPAFYLSPKRQATFPLKQSKCESLSSTSCWKPSLSNIRRLMFSPCASVCVCVCVCVCEREREREVVLWVVGVLWFPCQHQWHSGAGSFCFFLTQN